MSEVVDVLVIGGGINGAGIARDAAGRGLNVVLAEKDDIGQGTSSRSGKYIHGGLRYLEHYEFRLVREALIEREVVLEAAPHLARPLRLVLVHSPKQRPLWLIRLGLFLYDHLGGRRRIPGTTALRLDRTPEGAPLRPDFRHGLAYYDVWADDARLVLVNALDAKRRGAEVLPRTKVVTARRDGERWRVALEARDGTRREMYARAIVNAAGPWVETVLGTLDGVRSQKHVRLVKGSHIVMKRWWQGDHGYVLQAPDRRLIFVNPYFEDLALVGTTDIPFHGAPEDVAVSGAEVDYLLAILNRYFRTALTPEDVSWSYSGVRPLYDDDAGKGASEVTRDYTFELDDGPGKAPALTVFGGKLTTYRTLAEAALSKLAPHFPEMAARWTAAAPLPGGDLPGVDFGAWFGGFRARHGWLPEPLARHLGHAYGSEADRLLEGAAGMADLGAHFGGIFYEREARWLIAEEWAVTAEDLLFRRTKHGLFLGPEEQARVALWLDAQGAG